MRALAVALALLAGACGPAAGEDAGARDAGTPREDAGAWDAGTPREDAGARSDASSRDAGVAEPSVVILSLNLHCLELDGTPHPSHAARFAAIAAAVAREGVDVLLLQEVCDDGTVDAAAGLLAALEAEGAGTFEAQVVFAHLAWEGTPEEARESVAVLGRSLGRPTELVHRVQDGLRRVAAAADVETDLGTLRVLSVHFDHLDADARRAQARESAAVALSEADPSLAVVVGGDLNARAGSEAFGAFAAMGFVEASEAAGGDRIDHVFVHRGTPVEVREARRLFDTSATRVSDHPGVLVRLAAGAPEAVTVTRVVAEHDPGFGRHLWIRGSVAPLGWTRGWPMHALSPGRWRFVATELAGTVELKALVDDVTWQTGANQRVGAGDDLTFTPSF